MCLYYWFSPDGHLLDIFIVSRAFLFLNPWIPALFLEDLFFLAFLKFLLIFILLDFKANFIFISNNKKPLALAPSYKFSYALFTFSFSKWSLIVYFMSPLTQQSVRRWFASPCLHVVIAVSTMQKHRPRTEQGPWRA